MPPRALPKCLECQKTESLLWRNHENGQICQECFEQKEKAAEAAGECAAAQHNADKLHKDAKEKDRDSNGGSGGATNEHNKSANSVNEEKRLRKSTRATRFKTKITSSAATAANGSINGVGVAGPGNGNGATLSGGGKSQNKGRNRRNLFKKTPFKTPSAQATTHSVESVFHKGSYQQVGDIVSLVDNEHYVFYAQVRGLLVDNYCEKSAFLTWLIPTQASPDPTVGFDAATYLIGPDEDLSRKLSCLEFVMHAPSNYYLDRTTPFPLPDNMEIDTKPGGYIWTTLPEYYRKKSIT